MLVLKQWRFYKRDQWFTPSPPIIESWASVHILQDVFVWVRTHSSTRQLKFTHLFQELDETTTVLNRLLVFYSLNYRKVQDFSQNLHRQHINLIKHKVFFKIVQGQKII